VTDVPLASPGGALPRHRNRWTIPADGGPIDLRRPVVSRPATLAAAPRDITVDLASTALIIVDLQNDFCAPNGWLASIGADVSVLAGAVSHSDALARAARAAGVPVIWLNWGNRPDQANLPPGVTRVYDPDGTGVGIGHVLPSSGAAVLTKDSWGAALTAPLRAEPGDIHVDKYRMSGFWDTELDSVLRNLRADTLLFAGVNSDQCVYATLIDAACVGYDVVLVTDASATTSPGYCHEATIYNTRQCSGFTTETGAVLGALGQPELAKQEDRQSTA
jgi:ureidoacrylate peracid hydrolase